MTSGKFAPVANLPVYEMLAESGDLGSYHLLIASEVLKAPKAWGAFWTRRSLIDGEPVFTIMDNALIELGYPLESTQLVAAAAAVMASCIVLPDVLGDAKETMQLAGKALDDAVLRGSGFPLMGVVQGTTLLEVDTTVRFYMNAGVEYLSVPRVMTDIFGSRVELTKRVWDWAYKPIHLLGFSNDLHDDMVAAVQDGVMGIDSAVPLWAGMEDHRLDEITAMSKRPKNYWDRVPVTDKQFLVMLENVRLTRSLINQARINRKKATLETRMQASRPKGSK